MKKLISLFVILLSLASFAGDKVKNGSGASEKNVLFAYLNLGKFIDICLNKNPCGLSDQEIQILGSIRRNLPLERVNPQLIEFSTYFKNPSLFTINGEIKIAVTGNTVMDTIYINSDLLYNKGPNGEIQLFSVEDGISLLIHELGHHLGITSHSLLDLIGIKVARMVSKFSDRASLNPFDDEFMVLSLNSSTKEEGHPDLLLYIENKIYNLSEELKNALICRQKMMGAPMVRQPISSTFHNLYWKNPYKKIISRINSQEYTYTVVGTAVLQCQVERMYNNTFENQVFNVILEFKVKKITEEGIHKRWEFQTNRLSIKTKFQNRLNF